MGRSDYPETLYSIELNIFKYLFTLIYIQIIVPSDIFNSYYITMDGIFYLRRHCTHNGYLRKLLLGSGGDMCRPFGAGGAGNGTVPQASPYMEYNDPRRLTK